MRILQRVTVALFVVVAVAFIGTKVYISRMVDRVPPVITCESDVVEVPVGAAEYQLLSGVTATDERDGDLTGEIMIKGISQLITADTAKITYIVFDEANNMATAQRAVHYTDYEKPKISLTAPLMYQTGDSIRLLPNLTAHDTIDGDITGNIRVTNQNVDSGNSGVYSVTLQVTNSLGDVESVPAKVVIRDFLPAEAPIVLSDYIAYLNEGAYFAPRNYVRTPMDMSAVEVESNVDTSVAGIYEVSYTLQNYTVYQTVVVR